MTGRLPQPWASCALVSSDGARSTWTSTAGRPARRASIPSRIASAMAGSAALGPDVTRPTARSTAPARSIWVLRSSGRSRGSTRSSSCQVCEEGEVTREVARHEEVSAHLLAAGRAHAADQLGVVEQIADAKRRALDGLDDVAGDAVGDLERN